MRQNDFFSHLRRQLLFRRPESLLHLVQQHLEGGGSQLGRHLRPLPGPNVIKLFLSVIFELVEYARVFVSVMPLQPSLMFVGKARSLPK
jgi:hypothetical protein